MKKNIYIPLVVVVLLFPTSPALAASCGIGGTCVADISACSGKLDVPSSGKGACANLSTPVCCIPPAPNGTACFQDRDCASKFCDGANGWVCRSKTSSSPVITPPPTSASPAVAQCLNTCAGTCNENASTGVVTCSTDAGAASPAVTKCLDTCAGTCNENASTGVVTCSTGTAPTGSSGFTALAPIPGLTDISPTSVINSTTLSTFFNNLYKYLIGLAATLAVIEIIWAGLDISFFHKDAVGAIVEDKGRIYNAIFGLILVLSPYLVFSIINPSILNLSLNLPPINLNTPAGGVAGGGGGTAAAPDPTSGCSAVSGTKGILQIAICPSDSTATTWGAGCTDGNLSLIEHIVSSGTGVATSVITCAGKPVYTFIDPSGWITSVVKRIQPLARATTERPANGSDAVSFAAICHNANLGWGTCVSDYTLFSAQVPCGLTGANAGTTWKCYTETLSCEPNTFAAKCADSPPWTPFQ